MYRTHTVLRDDEVHVRTNKKEDEIKSECWFKWLRKPGPIEADQHRESTSDKRRNQESHPEQTSIQKRPVVDKERTENTKTADHCGGKADHNPDDVRVKIMKHK